MERVRAALAVGALAAALSACGHGGAVVEHPASTAAAGIDVSALWQQAADRCTSDPNAASPLAPPDPHGFGVAAAWPTDEAVQSALDAMHPTGGESFTLERLIDLRAALLNTRYRIATTATHGAREVELAPAYGRDAAPHIAAVSRDIAALGSDWKLDQEFLASEIGSGTERPATGPTAAAMRAASTAREAICH